ncbi:MAG: DUF427 domain-containing protein [Prochlorococcus sp.]|tara:strand:+ start:339 stop:809 length:471 start_codon:yes stop_codon:yes gene_type:complete
MSVEIVAEYPRPPALVACSDHVIVEALGTRICETYDCQRVLETFHPPTYYMPPQAMRMDLLIENPRRSFCEWKGVAKYWDLVIAEEYLVGAIWSYPNPTTKFKSLTGWYALYPGRMSHCSVNGEKVIPQPGKFYGGWITSQVLGPFKGDLAHPELI